MKQYIERSVDKVRKLVWRANNCYAPNSVPVFIFGAQRSGTTMLGSCLGRSPEIKHYSEHNPRAFENFILRDDEIIDRLVKRCAQKVVLFKPLTSSHRVKELVTRYGEGRAIWMYRHYENRANSAVNKFGAHNLELLRDFAVGRDLSRWQGQGIDAEEIELIRRFEPNKMTRHEAAMLFWYFRNNLFFKQHLESDPNVCLVSYEQLVQKPELVMRKLCAYLECSYYPYMVERVHMNSLKVPKKIGHEDWLQDLCDHMYGRLEDTRQAIGVA